MAHRIQVTGYLVTPEPIGLTPDVLGIRLGELEDLTITLVEDDGMDEVIDGLIRDGLVVEVPDPRKAAE